MQLNKIPILCTRPLSRELIQIADDNGFRIDIVPFIRTEPVEPGELAVRIQQFLSQSITAVFTSMTAAETVISLLNGSKPLWRIFCIGGATRKTLVQYFGEKSIAAFANNASALANTIIETGNVRDAIFFCGDQRRDELPLLLIDRQIPVEEIIVYRTIKLINTINKEYRAILFFSPSAVSSFFSNNSVPAQTILFAIGKTTADSLRKYSNNPIVVADETGKEDLVNKMIRYFQSFDHEKILTETKE